MKLLGNSTKIFIETLERQAIKRKKNGDVEVLDKELYNIYELYKQGKIKFQDHIIEAAAIGSSLSTVRFLDESDNKKVGIRNIANAALNENEYFCPIAVALLGKSGIAADTDAAMQATNFGAIDAIGALPNGQLDIIVNTGEYLLREYPTSGFIGRSGLGEDAPTGLKFLDNVTIIKPKQRNEINLKTAVALPALTAVKVVIYGTRTTPVGK